MKKTLETHFKKIDYMTYDARKHKLGTNEGKFALDLFSICEVIYWNFFNSDSDFANKVKKYFIEFIKNIGHEK